MKIMVLIMAMLLVFAAIMLIRIVTLLTYIESRLSTRFDISDELKSIENGEN